MPQNQATLLPDGTGPAHLRLASALRTRITTGLLRPGEALPASRALADELGVSRWVVTEAYDQLKAEGYLSGQVGSATRVSSSGVRTPLPAREASPAAHQGGLIDLSPALPDLGSFPRQTWKAALGRALAQVTDHQLGHPQSLGTDQLRQSVAGYLRRVRALDVTSDSVQITQGVSNALWLLCRHLVASGARRVAVEDPSWPRLRRVAAEHGLEVVAIEVDPEGLDVAALIEADRHRRIDAVFVMPTHQFPTGVPMSPERRLALLHWAADRHAWIVEDDYDAEFRYDRRPVGALAALDPQRVVYLGSVSKTLSPSLHLGWMVAPPRLAHAIETTRQSLGVTAPALEQLALVDMIESGAYDRHLRRMRREYRLRRQAFVAALEATGVGQIALSMDSGLHVLWWLPQGSDEAAVITRCRAVGLSVLGLSACRVNPGRPGLVLGYGNVAGHRATQIATTLAAVVRDGIVQDDGTLRP